MNKETDAIVFLTLLKSMCNQSNSLLQLTNIVKNNITKDAISLSKEDFEINLEETQCNVTDINEQRIFIS